jgi:hypothetical protein
MRPREGDGDEEGSEIGRRVGRFGNGVPGH